LPDTAQHRERFDVGLIHRSTTSIPFYVAGHYWHNGGHENPHTVAVTENYTFAAGLRTDDYSALYLGALFCPDRSQENLNVFGHALFFEYNLRLGNWVFQPQVFITSQYIPSLSTQRFVSIEGDPFYRIPLYLGFNFYRTWKIYKDLELKLGFVNGMFANTVGSSLSPRYDQMIRIDFAHDISL
jgi:hypothetical protein